MKSLKQLIIIVLAFVVFLGTFGLENAFAGPVAQMQAGHLVLVIPANASAVVIHGGNSQMLSGQTHDDLAAGDSVQVKSGQGVELDFSNNGLVRLSADAVVDVDYLDPTQDAYVLNLKNGRAWINNIYTSARFNLIAQGAYLIPDYAAVDVKIDGQNADIYANRHQVSIGLVPLDYTATSAKLFPESDFINSYLLPEGSQTTVYSDKITQDASTLKQLYYSKLVKEFPFGIIDPQLLSSDPWLQQNIQADTTLQNTIADQFSGTIRARGLKIEDLNSFGYTFGESLNNFYNVLTFSQNKVLARLNNDIFDNFDDIKYLLAYGQTTRAQDRLNSFKSALDNGLSSYGDPYKPLVLARLRQEYDSLSFVSPDDPLALAKSTVNDYLLNLLGNDNDSIGQKFLLIRNTMNGVYDLADQNSLTARQALQNYYNQFTQLINQEKNQLAPLQNILAEENQIMNNLLLRYPIFYQDTYFAMKNELEQDWLALLPEGDAKNEEKQTIISTKIDFLNQLKTFFLADKIDPNDAKQIVFRLFHEVDALQLPADQQVAVNQLFDQRLSDFGVFYNYLNSPEYVATTLHGSARIDQFNQFVQAQQEQVSIEQVKQEILGNQTQQSITPDQILAQAQQDFSTIGATNVTFGTVTGQNQTTIAVQSGTIAGYQFSAQYQWDQKLVSQIYVGSQLISQNPVNLQNLALLIQNQMQQATQQTNPAPQQPASPPSQQATQQPAPAMSKTELVARILLVQKLRQNDVQASQSSIVIDDLSNGLFTIQSANLVSDPTISFSFDINTQTDVVTNLSVNSAEGPQTVQGGLNLSNLSALVKATVQSAASQQTTTQAGT